MKINLFSFLLLAPILAFCQAQKGGVPITNHQSPITGTTRAVVVGISDYQSPDIPDLRFADRDAGAFADWLKSPAGGSVPAENILFLKNAEATNAAFAAALDWLVEVSKEGENAVIYFSGHGDVETKTLNQLGFLLLHDSPARCYKAGAYSLFYLQDVISTLSIQNRVRVTVVTDACHAGKLAGTSVNGTQATALNLAKQFGNETKILSCQPNEFSLEGEQWGGGRGVFSWHLMDGLVGLADKNSDGAVNLFEIGRYLEDMVPAETAPQNQLPMTVGDRQTTLARVDAATLASLRAEKSGQKPALAATGSKGFEEVYLREADSLTQRLYADFKTALQNHELLDAAPGHRSADDLFRELAQKQDIAPMHSLMRRNLAVALQDEVQQAINALLDNDPYEANTWSFHPEKYSQYPAYLARAIELLGEKHYMAASLKSKKAYFEGYEIAKTFIVAEGNPTRRDSLREAAKRKYLEGISFDPDAAYLYFAIGDLYLFNSPNRTDSLVLWCSRAFDRSPGWVTPALEIAYEYQGAQQRIDLEEKWILEAQKVLPNSYLVMERVAWLRQWQGRRGDAVEMCQKMIAQKPDLFNGYATLANTLYNMDGDFKEVEKQARKAVEVYPHFSNWAYVPLANSLLDTRRIHEGIDLLLKMLESKEAPDIAYLLVQAYGLVGDYGKAEEIARQNMEENLAAFHQTEVLFFLGKIRVWQNRLPEAIALFEQSLAVNPYPDACFIKDWAWLGEVARLQNRPLEADSLFKKALAYDSGSGWEDMKNKDEAYYLYGNFFLRQNRLDEAAAEFQKSLDIRRKGFWGEYGFALLAAQKGNKTEALDWLEKSLDNFYPESASILAEPLFSKIRKTKRFKAMMAKHFPEK